MDTVKAGWGGVCLHRSIFARSLVKKDFEPGDSTNFKQKIWHAAMLYGENIQYVEKPWDMVKGHNGNGREE